MQYIAEKRGHRWLPLIALAVALTVIALVARDSSAVHDDGLFELDTTSSSTICSASGLTAPCGNANTADDSTANPPYDWESICKATNAPTDRTITAISPTPTGVDQLSCIADWFLPDNTKFATGSKDIGDIAPGGFVGSGTWQCTAANNVLEKDEIMNAYAALMTDPDDDHRNLYVGLERPSNNGTSFVGFWFIQEDVSCEGPDTTNWSGGLHTAGDLLILSDFSGGGRVSTVRILQWNPNNVLGLSQCTPGTPPTGSGNLIPDPNVGPLCEIALAGQDCSLAVTGDSACAVVNNEPVQTPWWNQPKKPPCSPNKGGTQHASPPNNPPCTVIMAKNQLFEGGIDLTAALCPSGTTCPLPCFSTFVAETRSSDTETADLKDFARGEFPVCGSKAGVKFHDLNANGAQDTGEPGLEGWTINLYVDANGNGVLDAAETASVQSQVTDSTGAYKFSELNPGQYIVCEVISDQDADYKQSLPAAGPAPTPPATGPADCSEGTPDTGLGDVGYAFTIEQLEDETGNDFGNFLPASKSGEKFIDLDADGQPKEAGEDCSNFPSPNVNNPGCQGVTIHIQGTDGKGNAVHLHTTTDAGGEYSFAGLNPGTYTVCEEAPTGFIQSFPTSGANCSAHAAVAGGTVGAFGYAITLTSDENETANNFGNFRNATKSGVKFNDLNSNGVKDAGEPGINGVEIHLFGTDGAGASVHLHTTTATVGGVAGSYSFSVKPGSYTVCETIPTGFVQTAPAAGPGIVSCAGHSGGGGGTAGGLGYAITLTSGQVDNNNHFGNHQGSLIIRKEAKNANTPCPAGTPTDPGCHDLQPGSPQTFRIAPNPLPGAPGAGGVAYLDVTDQDSNDAYATVGLICINNVIIGPTYSILETAAPANYQIPAPPNNQKTSGASSTNCAGRAATPQSNTAGDVTFVNNPLSEIEIIFRSLAGTGVTIAQISCPPETADNGGIEPNDPDDVGEDGAADNSGPGGTPAFDDLDEVYSALLEGTYNCTIIIDP